MSVTVQVHHKCGHSAQVVSPGPLDPQGLIQADGPRGLAQLGLASRPCLDCASVAPLKADEVELCNVMEELYDGGDPPVVCILPIGHEGEHQFAPAQADDGVATDLQMSANPQAGKAIDPGTLSGAGD